MIPWAFLLLALLPGPLQAQDLCLVLSGEERGYLEPCGCARPPLGGIAKRDTFLKSLSEPWLAVSLGDLAGHVRRQDELKAETLTQALKVMGYSIHNLGEKDLDMGLDVLAYLFPPGSVPLLSSNVRLSVPLLEIAPYKVYEVGAGLKPAPTRIGFLGILSPHLIGTPPAGVEIIPPAGAMPPLIEELKGRVDALVLLSHADMEESIKLARDFPEFRLIVSGHGADHPTVLREGNTWVVSPGIKGKHLLLCRFNSALGSWSVETITLDERFKDSDPMLGLIDNYQQRLREEKLLSGVERFPLPGQASYVGSRACGLCHPAIFQHWGTTPHAEAYETLLKVDRAFDPECVDCHVVGLRYIGGFESLGASPELKGVGCEACHGPGSLHVAECGMRGTKRGISNSELRIPNSAFGKVSPEVCQGCHDPEHGPSFQYEAFWGRIKHPVETPLPSTRIK
jgi:hypothetical protein